MTRFVRNARYLFLLTVGFVLSDPSTEPLFAGAPPPPICEEVCDSQSPCDEVCYLNLMEFENGNDTNCLEFGVFDQDGYCCGDGTCNVSGGEACGNCSDDCGTCLSPEPTCGGSGCQQGENCNNCAQDCGSCGSSGSCDGDGSCESGEDKSCSDCMTAGYCRSDSDCPDVPEGNDYTCVDDRCVLRDLPIVTQTCNSDNDCEIGWKCKYKVGVYQCPGGGSFCKVCVPPWDNTAPMPLPVCMQEH